MDQPIGVCCPSCSSFRTGRERQGPGPVNLRGLLRQASFGERSLCTVTIEVSHVTQGACLLLNAPLVQTNTINTQDTSCHVRSCSSKGRNDTPFTSVAMIVYHISRSVRDDTPHRLRVRSAVACVAVGVRLPTEAVGLSAQAECHNY
jgi:hypothetical protein